jgi:hypothetical protein
MSWPFNFETGATTRKKEISVNQPVDQFILNSTSPRNKAFEGLLSPDAKPGEERGAFTSALIDGLNGDGTAKVYSLNDNQYLVKKESLFDYVIKKILDRRIFVIKDPVHPVMQMPRKDGESAKNPVLALIPMSAVKPQPLELLVEPDDVLPQTRLSISGESQDFTQTFEPPIEGLPLPLPPLQPMNYTLFASAPNHVLEGKNEKRRSISLYEPMQVSVRLIPLQVEVSIKDAPSDPQPIVSASSSATSIKMASKETGSAEAASDEGARARGMESFEFPIESGGGGAVEMSESISELEPQSEAEPQKFAQLIIESSDPLAPLEIANSTGELKKAGQGRLELGDLEAGFYRARIVTPEGQTAEETLQLSIGETETVKLDAPALPQTRLMQKVMESANFLVQQDNTLDISKTVGPIASAQISTILALAANVANQSDTLGMRLRSLGLTPFSESATATIASSGLEIISGVEFTSQQEISAYLSGAKLRLWPQGDLIPESSESPVALDSVPGIAEYAKPAQSGPHWLAVEIADQSPVIFSLSMLPQRLTMLVFHRDVEGRTRTFQYLPGLQPGEGSDLNLIRRLELMQRFSLSGRFNNAYELAREPLNAEVADPLALCLGGYLAIKLKDRDGLLTACKKLDKFYPQLSDGHVLRGEHEALIGEPGGAAAAYSEALNHGLPIFGDGLVRLSAAVGRHEITHPRVKLLDRVLANRVRGLLWSAWTVEREKLSPGRLLEE